ncbi:hypothetical protein ABT186_18715 [Streptomyces sp. NPDC001634]|uniref:hypothetical protein n=1 Tax=Streptomyces sp. NPDC001634 TaxID=3154390 RepID=UPI0033233D3C
MTQHQILVQPTRMGHSTNSAIPLPKERRVGLTAMYAKRMPRGEKSRHRPSGRGSTRRRLRPAAVTSPGSSFAELVVEAFEFETDDARRITVAGQEGMNRRLHS